MALSLPPHDCIVPVLHHYHSDKPSLKDARWGLPASTEIECLLRDAAATRTLFVVMPLYRTSLRAWVTRQRDEGLAAPYGMTWQWWGKLLTRMLGAVQHLIKNGVSPLRTPIVACEFQGFFLTDGLCKCRPCTEILRTISGSSATASSRRRRLCSGIWARPGGQYRCL